MAKEEGIQLRGVIKEVKLGAVFIVELENKSQVFTHLCGKMKMNFIKVTPGDKVLVELSPYDLTRGRILRRE